MAAGTPKTSRKYKFFSRKNVLLYLILSVIFFVGTVTFYKLVAVKPVYVYAKIKIGQGSWWAVTAKPPVWIATALKRGQLGYDTVGRPIAEIVSIRKYPQPNNGYDIYLTVRLKVNYNKKTSSYTFNRSSLSITSPIELTFSNTSITGTVIDISQKPFIEHYVSKIINLENREGFVNNSPVISEDIQPGDTYSDGTRVVMTVLSTNSEISNQPIGSVRDRKIQLKVLVQEKSDGLYYGEEYKIANNSTAPFATQQYFISGFTITSIE